MNKFLLTVAALSLAVSSVASASCRTINFESSTVQYHGEKQATVNNPDSILKGDVKLCADDKDTATLTIPATKKLPEQTETLQRISDDVFMYIGTPDDSDKITTLEVWHFSNDGSVNYVKTINGVGKFKNFNTDELVDMNRIVTMIGKWYL